MPLFVISIIATVDIYAVTKYTIDSTHNLRISQRKLFENYFSLKTFYLGEDLDLSPLLLEDKIR